MQQIETTLNVKSKAAIGVELDWQPLGTSRVEKSLRSDAREWLSRKDINHYPLSKSGHGAPSLSPPSLIAHCGRCRGCGQAWRFRLIRKRVMQIEIAGEGRSDF